MPPFQGSNTIGYPAPVAQWTEHQPSKLLVVSSNLARGAKYRGKTPPYPRYGGVLQEKHDMKIETQVFTTSF